MARILIILLISCLGFQGFSQSLLGDWQEHLPFSNAVKLIQTNEGIYCGTQSGLFEYNPDTYLIREWSKVNGLSGVSISTMGYSQDHKTLIIGYTDSNIDLLVNQQRVINIPDVKNKQMTGSKRINSIHIHGDQAFVSTGFGIIVINLLKGEISSTYHIGEDGEHVEVFESMIFNYDSIFAATAKGIRKAFVRHPNLENYRFWENVVGLPHKDEAFTHLAYQEGKLYASHQSTNNQLDSIYIYNGHRWSSYPFSYKEIRELRFQQGNLLAVSEFQINLMTPEGQRLWHLKTYGYDFLRAYDAFLEEDGTLWIADQLYGLLKTNDRENFEEVRPQGPWDRRAFDLALAGDDLWVASGGYDGAWNNVWNYSGISTSSNGACTTFNPKTTPAMEGVRDIVRIAVDPQNPKHVFAGSWGAGILEFENGEFVQLYDDTNTDGGLSNIIPGKRFVRIGGLAFDSQNNLWASNSSVPSPIVVKKTDGTWKNFPYGTFTGDAFTGKLEIIQGGGYADVKWVQLPRGNGLFAFYNGPDLDDTSDDLYQKISVRAIWPQNNIKVLNDIYSMAVDHENNLWIGTSNGVALYYAPNRVFNDYPRGNFYCQQPNVDQGDSLYHALLETEIVTAIAVDGANRKWFGTRNSGVFLTDPDGNKLIKSFNVINSPLLSNNIFSITINQDSGEVYFATEAGIVSYQGDAITEAPNETQIYAFPNPVRPDYEGPITIRGVAANSIVKITDINANLVYETESLGGQVIWNGKDLQGQRVHSGVYLVLSSTSMGEKKSIAKILFVR